MSFIIAFFYPLVSAKSVGGILRIFTALQWRVGMFRLLLLWPLCNFRLPVEKKVKEYMWITPRFWVVFVTPMLYFLLQVQKVSSQRMNIFKVSRDGRVQRCCSLTNYHLLLWILGLKLWIRSWLLLPILVIPWLGKWIEQWEVTLLIIYPNITYYCFCIAVEKKTILKPETSSSLFSVLHAVCSVTLKSKEGSE